VRWSLQRGWNHTATESRARVRELWHNGLSNRRPHYDRGTCCRNGGSNCSPPSLQSTLTHHTTAWRYTSLCSHIVNSLHKLFWTTNLHTTKAQTMELRNANANSIKSHEFLPTDRTITVALTIPLSGRYSPWLILSILLQFLNMFLLVSWGGVRQSTWHVDHHLDYSTSPGWWMMMSVEQSVEWLAGETEVLRASLPQCRFVHHKSRMTLHELEPRPPRWEAGD
jgi:hypothetical protein